MDSLKETLSNVLSSPTAILTGLTVLFCLLNFKSLPFVWHLRLLSAFIQHSRPPSNTTTHSPQVFHHLTTTTRCSIPEIDYAVHKSNSTYFTDLDISRVHLLLSLFQSGITKLQKDDEYKGRGKVMPVLGGVSASFRRAIKPWGKYEVVSRVLSWDEKWIYIGSWFVVPGSMGRGKSTGSSEKKTPEPMSKYVYASAMAKYVIKAGKVTVPPERLLVASGLVPVGDSEEAKEVRMGIEGERLRALEYGRALSKLDGQLGELDGEGETLGFFRDLF